MKDRIPAFSALLIMIALSFVGIACLPMLNIQYKPSNSGRTIRVTWSYPGASPEIVEAEVTSRSEGVMSRLSGNTGTSSVSRNGSGTASVTFPKNTDLAAVRLELASAIRNIYPSFPAGVTYPVISHGVGGTRSETSLSYLIKGSLPSLEIEKYTREHILPALADVKGVDNVGLYGATPFQWVITYDPDKLQSAGLKPDDIESAFRQRYNDNLVGMSETDGQVMAIRLALKGDDDFGSLPIGSNNGQIVRLRDVAVWRYQEALPSSYYRVNGLNTITVAVSTVEDANLLAVADDVRKTMIGLQERFPAEISANLVYDSSEYVAAELGRIYLRTGICLALLLLFVLIVYRSWRYMLTVIATLSVNLLIAVTLYALAGISVHIYTLAGITVSLGIIIDTSIVMIDHYARTGNRKAFPSLVAAVGTTVAALMLVLLLPEKERANLTDFIWVIALNLTLSLLVSYLFIPALMSYMPSTCSSGTSGTRLRRRMKRRQRYERYISWGLQHRWIYVLVMVAGFGLPLCLLPQASSLEKKKNRNVFQEILYKVVSWEPYSDNRQVIDKVAGTSFAAFYKALDRSDFYREPERKTLHINAGMLEGCTVHQLNEVVRSMENFLAGFEEIESFTTNVISYSDADITVKFKPEYEDTAFPSQLKASATSMAINFGGANWSIYGIDDQGFNNNVVSDRRSHRITLTGYNYRELYAYAEYLTDYLSRNKRVSGAEIWGAGWRGSPKTEFHMAYDFERMAAAGITPAEYYSSLSSVLYDRTIGAVDVDGEWTDVVLESSDIESFDLWHVLNVPLTVGAQSAPLKDIGSIQKRHTNVDITKSKQTYEINVCYDFVGSYELVRRVSEEAVDHMNEEILPVGYKAENPASGWFNKNKDRYAWLIFLIIAAIYVMLSITFESLRLPFAVILMVPVSFIGLFLVFGLSELSFDQGGFAAFVMLCGIVVNAGIYIIMSFQKHSVHDVRSYVKAFSVKITPIMLTIISTVLGLIPFLTDGPQEVFWFDFAVGTIGGMLFSILALVFVLPVFAIRKTRR